LIFFILCYRNGIGAKDIAAGHSLNKEEFQSYYNLILSRTADVLVVFVQDEVGCVVQNYIYEN